MELIVDLIFIENFTVCDRTDLDAEDVHGSDPQNLFPNILRSKIYENTYWLSACFGLNAETLVDR